MFKIAARYALGNAQFMPKTLARFVRNLSANRQESPLSYPNVYRKDWYLSEYPIRSMTRKAFRCSE